MSDRQRVLYQLEANTKGPGAARAIISTELEACVAPERLDDIRLLASELVSERVGCLSAGDHVVLDLHHNSTICCRVLDHGPATVPTGFASQLLDLLADAWGVLRSHRGTETWFEISE